MPETPEQRSRIMRAIKHRDTKPEMMVRRTIHRMGYRYRLHRKDLPGKPDIVFTPRRKVVFVNGCFWHGHDCRRGARVPKSNVAYWRSKIERNRERDVKNREELERRGWRVLVVWECETRHAETLKRRLQEFLGAVA